MYLLSYHRKNYNFLLSDSSLKSARYLIWWLEEISLPLPLKLLFPPLKNSKVPHGMLLGFHFLSLELGVFVGVIIISAFLDSWNYNMLCIPWKLYSLVFCWPLDPKYLNTDLLAFTSYLTYSFLFFIGSKCSRTPEKINYSLPLILVKYFKFFPWFNHFNEKSFGV